MNKNSNLHAAKAAKNDEFYTQLTDIEKELKHYRPHFRDKIVFCNCNDLKETSFAKFFSMNFEVLGLKKLICTSYNDGDGKGSVAIYTGDKNGNHIPDPDEWETKRLEGPGDFRSPECIELLKEADIVCTNPPFSLFREYIGQLMQYGKKFLIIGNMNSVNYLCPLIKDNKMWLGYTSPKDFVEPNNNVKKFGNILWFTNLEHIKRHEPLDLYKKYIPKEYPKYDNYDAIEVSKVADIPMDYKGIMGVPISFLDKYCPEQFEIIGITYSADRNPDIESVRIDPKKRHVGIINGKEKYPRILIRRK